MRICRDIVCCSTCDAGVLTIHPQGMEPPPQPAAPDFRPAAERGVLSGLRELAVSFVRIAYEKILVECVGLSRAQPFLRDGNAHVREVVVKRIEGEPVHKKVSTLFFAYSHSVATFYAAECTVSVMIHTYQVRVAWWHVYVQVSALLSAR